MKRFACEMCGSGDLIKQDGFYVCQSCGTKYTPEDAKKLMIEGTVQVDKSNELDNLYTLARRAKETNDGSNALKYYQQILSIAPNDWEAVFYAAYFQLAESRVINIENAVVTFTSSCPKAMKLVWDSDIPFSEKQLRITQIGGDSLHILTGAANTLIDMYTKQNNSYNMDEKKKQLSSRCEIIGQCAETIGDGLAMLSETKEWKEGSRESALPTKKTIATLYKNADLWYSVSQNRTHFLNDYKKKRILEIYPEWHEESSNLNGGCYVATCVYGSYDCPEVWTLRRYRDHSLAKTWYGRAFIHLYYAVSPTVVRWFGHTEWFRKMWKGRLDHMVNDLKNRGFEDTPYKDRSWK
ncbi:MAG: TFIIB-type zinc finger domain-containing protein [Oscillospiraceae bacterium]|nr:TFIIB-type zinc finger domain-containing protein [Oscillospiraceae bacterium]